MHRHAMILTLLAVAAVAVAAAGRAPSTLPAEVQAAVDAKTPDWYSFCNNTATGTLVPTHGVISGCEAFAFFNDDIETTGWSYLHVESDDTLDGQTQAWAAGFAEGYLTATRIKQSLVNSFVAQWPNSTGTVPANVYQWINTQYEYVKASAAAAPTDSYWQNAIFVYQQVEGMVAGSAAGGYTVTFQDLLVLNMIAEVGDVMAAIDPVYRASIDVLRMHDLERVKKTMMQNSHCSALIRLAPNNADLFSAHTTWTGYANLLRTYKYYNVKPLATLATGIQFSSYPGCVSSIDDFYQASSGLIVIETTNNLANMSLYDLVKPQSVPCFVRVMVANRMAITGQDWHDTFARENSGTYNNQWMIVNNNEFTPGEQPRAGTLYIATQLPGKVVGRDVTDILIKQGYWPSYNIPYFPEVWTEAGYGELVQQYGVNGAYLWDYTGSFRQVIFAREAPKVATIEDVMKLIQYNHWQTDPASHGSAELSIAARADLSASPLDGAAQAMGAIDAKVSSASYMRNATLQVLTKSGPTIDDQTPFVWSTSAWNSQPHEGQPDKFAFAWRGFSVVPSPKQRKEALPEAELIALA